MIAFSLAQSGMCAICIAFAQENPPVVAPAPATASVVSTNPAKPAEAKTLDKVTVIGRRENLVGEAISASEGSIGQADIAGSLKGI